MKTAAGAVLFFGVWVTHALSPVSTQYDSRWTVHTALSLLHEGNLDLDEYLPQLERDSFYYTQCVTPGGRVTWVRERSQCAGGHYYSFFPVGAVLLATPGVAAIEQAVKLARPYTRAVAAPPLLRKVLDGDLVGGSAVVEVALASLFVALTAVVVYTLVLHFRGVPVSLAIAVIFAFGTAAWSTVSRALWQHGPSMLLLAGVLLLFLRTGRRPALAAVAGLPLAFSFIVRPTNAIAIVLFTAYVWVRHRKYFRCYLLWAAPAAAVFFTLTYWVYHSLVPPYFDPEHPSGGYLGLHPAFGEALMGNLIAPARGLFIFSPVVLLATWGILLRPPSDEARCLRPWLVAIICLHWVLISLFADWKGGHSIGPRYFSDLLPYFAWFLIPVFDRGKAAVAVLALLSLPGFWINHRCATRFACHQWNIIPDDINRNEGRVWDWRDPPFLR